MCRWRDRKEDVVAFVWDEGGHERRHDWEIWLRTSHKLHFAWCKNFENTLYTYTSLKEGKASYHMNIIFRITQPHIAHGSLPFCLVTEYAVVTEHEWPVPKRPPWIDLRGLLFNTCDWPHYHRYEKHSNENLAVPVLTPISIGNQDVLIFSTKSSGGHTERSIFLPNDASRSMWTVSESAPVELWKEEGNVDITVGARIAFGIRTKEVKEAVEMISDCGRTFAGKGWGILIAVLVSAIGKVKFDYRCGFVQVSGQ